MILISCPVSNRETVLPYYLQSILDLYHSHSDMTLYFIVNNSTDNSLNILNKFKQTNKHINIIIEICNDNNMPKDIRTKEIRRNYTYHWLALLRNKMLDKCVELDCDYLLSCDSDILMRPDTLTRLLEHKEHCISSLVYNGYYHTPKGAPVNYSPIDNAHMFPNCLNWDEDKNIYVHVRSKRISHPEENAYGTTIVTHFTGACILISKELASKARYGYFNRGEDAPFCRSARKLGYNVLCDVSLLNAHIMSESLLVLYKNGLLPHFTKPVDN